MTTHWRLVVGEVERLLGGRQRDVHDRRVEHDHQLRDAEDARGSASGGRDADGFGASWRAFGRVSGEVLSEFHSAEGSTELETSSSIFGYCCRDHVRDCRRAPPAPRRRAQSPAHPRGRGRGSSPSAGWASRSTTSRATRASASAPSTGASRTRSADRRAVRGAHRTRSCAAAEAGARARRTRGRGLVRFLERGDSSCRPRIAASRSWSRCRARTAASASPTPASACARSSPQLVDRAQADGRLRADVEPHRRAADLQLMLGAVMRPHARRRARALAPLPRASSLDGLRARRDEPGALARDALTPEQTQSTMRAWRPSAR